MKTTKNFSQKIAVSLAGAFVLCASAGALMIGGEQPSVQSKAYNAQAFLNTVSYNDDEFTVELDKTPPTVDDHWVGWGWGKAVYQGRKVALDEGKKGLLITSKQSGSDVNGKGFAFGETMSGEFSIDFRLLSEQGYTEQASATPYNPYADVQKITFTFTDADTGDYFDVVITAGAEGAWEANAPEMWVSVPSGASYGHYYEHKDTDASNATEGDWFNSGGYYTRLDGTSFANTAEQAYECRFTAGAKSTKFYFDPTTMQVKADRYYLADDASIPADEQYKYEGSNYAQTFDGRNLVLRTEHSLVVDLDNDDLAATDKVTGFKNYTVKVTFNEVTPNDTVVPDAILEDGTEGEAIYDRYAKMYVYSLNGVDLTGQELIDSRQDIVIGDTWEDDDHNDDCLIAYATFNDVDYDWSEIDEAGVIISGYEKSYKFKFDMLNKQPDENGKFGMAIYGMPSGDYVVTSYVTYKGKMVTTASEDVRYVSNDPDLAVLKMSADEKTLCVDDEGQLNVNVFDKDVVWESDNESVATVAAQTDKAYATVTAHAVGTANIKATVNGETVVCAVEVKNVILKNIPANLVVDCDKAYSYQLRPNAQGGSDQVFTYASNNSEVVAVDANGLLTANSNGNAVVTVTHTASGESAEIAVRVKNFTLPDYFQTETFSWGHVQGMTIDKENSYTYFTFTTILGKTDLSGKTVASMTGYPGHMGDCTYNEADGKLYASLFLSEEYSWTLGGKIGNFAIAIIDTTKLTELNMPYDTPGLMKVVHLKDMEDYAKMTLSNGKVGKYGITGVDGTEIGPKFGSSSGKQYLTVAAGVNNTCDETGTNTRTDNEYQVLFQYDFANWWDTIAEPLSLDGMPSQSAKADGEYLILSGNGNFGIQDVAYDEYNKQWYFVCYGVTNKDYKGVGHMLVVSTEYEPKLETLIGQPNPEAQGYVLKPIEKGDFHEGSGIYSFGFWEGSSGLTSLGNGYFYLSIAAKTADGYQYADVVKYQWTGEGVGFKCLVPEHDPRG